MEWFQEYGDIAIAALFIIVVIQWIIMLTIQSKVKKLRKKYTAMMNGTGVDQLEDVIVNIQAKQAEHEARMDNNEKAIEKINQYLPKQKSKVAIKRYNAFSDTGSDLSFSVAIVNEEKDGVVLTSIHSRQGAYIYAKPIQKGESSYTLTPEEVKVIEDAH